MLPLPSNNVAVLVTVAKVPVYCLTYIGSLPSSAVAHSTHPELAAAPPTLNLKKSLSAIGAYIKFASFVPVNVVVTYGVDVAVVALPLNAPLNVVAVSVPELNVNPELPWIVPAVPVAVKT